MREIKKFLIIIALLLVSFLAGRHIAPKEPLSIRDTVANERVVWDTLVVSEPVVVHKYVRDTIRIPVEKEGEKDTVYVEVPREVKVYSDSSYRAVVSGYEPSLDSLEIYNSTVYRTVYEKRKPKRIGIGIQAGYGAGEGGLTPYIGIGISYNLLNL